MSELTEADIDRLKYIICCPMCDNKKCIRGSDKCEAEQWAKKQKEDER